MIDAERAAALLGEDIRSSTPLGGGDLSDVVRLQLVTGRTAIAKAGATALAEAEMLRALVGAGVPAPAVLAVSGDMLILQDLGTDAGLGAAWGDLGRVLRRLHQETGGAYGWHRNHAFGPVPIPNGPAASWPEFWVERRLQPSLDHLPPNLARRIEGLCGGLADRLPSAPPPALLHGDLWTGNVIAAGGTVSGLIDPACYHGHAEVDLAMLTLFGAPAPAFWAEYGEVAPGLAERRPIYQLWPALVHVRLFGVTYLGLLERLLAGAE